MQSFDYWDIDEILAEQEEVSVTPQHDIARGGILHPTAEGGRGKDLKYGNKVQVPFWLAQGMVRRNMVELELPTIYGRAVQEELQTDPIVCRLSDKSPYYFEIGIRAASLLKDKVLIDDLLDGLLKRWRGIVTLLGNYGVARTHASPLNPGESIFPRTFTVSESAMYHGGNAVESNFKEWCDGFASYKMKASPLADVPVAKRAKSGG